MTKDEALAYFNNRVLELAAAFEPPLSPQAIYRWGIIPADRQMQLEVMTKGELKADDGLWPKYHLTKDPITGMYRKQWKERK